MCSQWQRPEACRAVPRATTAAGSGVAGRAANSLARLASGQGRHPLRNVIPLPASAGHHQDRAAAQEPVAYPGHPLAGQRVNAVANRDVTASM